MLQSLKLSLFYLFICLFSFNHTGLAADDIDPKAFKARKNMEKVKLGPQFYLQSPITIIGATVDGKPNFQTAAWVSFANHKPNYIMAALNQNHFTAQGIRESETFSVNIPSSDMMIVVDYIGSNSGRDVDKTELFEVFYGDLKTAPMVRECPVNIEAKLVKTIQLPANHIFIGEVTEVYVGKDYQKEDSLDAEKIDPMIFSFWDMMYRKIGDPIGKAWFEGSKYKP